MKLIYEPQGKALEYSPLAANLYSGCAHGCRYCYAPSVMHQTRERFGASPASRKGVLKQLEKEARAMAGDPRPVLLCFTSDPYQPIEEKECITRRAIGILGENRMQISVLTKNGPLARRDFDLFKKYDVNFGTTLLLTDEKMREEWEPGAATLEARRRAIFEAHEAGIRTWVSMEPVLDPQQALALLNGHLSKAVDVWKIGKLNHDAAREKAIDWKLFLGRMITRLWELGANYYIKDDLWDFADEPIRRKYPKSRGVTLYTPKADA